MERHEVQQFDIVTAVFAPGRTEDLTDGARRMIGQRLTWSADFRVDEGFAYEGDWHMTLSRTDWKRTGVHWAPLCDLVLIERASADEIKKAGL